MTKTIHLIPNAHLDPAWLWDWREGMNEIIATCHCVVELMEENPDVTFTRGEAFCYEHIERHDAELFERIRALVKQGRWEIVGGAMLQPDTNLGAGESYVREYLYGQQYFRSRFGFVPDIAYQVDSFGHAAGLPSIYRAAGCRYAVQCRPSQKQRPTPSRIFRWRGPDGAEVLTANLDTYAVETTERKDAAYTLTGRIHREAADARAAKESWVMLVGLGDHGGGLNRQLLAEIRELMAHPPEGCALKFSTLAEFFRGIEPRRAEFPVVAGEQQYFARGCYTSAAAVKRTYRSAENLVLRAERWATVAAMLGNHAYPQTGFRDVWRDVLFNQFHDILPGTSIERVCAEAIDQLGKARHQCRGFENDAALAVLRNVDTNRHEGFPVLLFNPHGQPYAGPVEVEWFLDYRPLGPGGDQRLVKHVAAIAPDGARVATQFLPTEMIGTSEWRIRSAFEARVPACGYAVYWMQPAPAAVPLESAVRSGSAPHLFIANEHLTVSHRAGEAGIRVTDTVTGRDWFTAAAGAGVALEDNGDSWGIGIDRWEQERGRFEPEHAEVLYTGPLKAALLLVSRYRASRLIQVFALYRGERRVRCTDRWLWQEPAALCKLVFPANVRQPRGRYHTPYAVSERPAGEGEVPALTWASIVAADGTGVGIANTSQYGFDIIENTLRMSLVRSPLYGCTTPPPHQQFRERVWMDHGLHDTEYVLTAPDDVAAAARELNMPLHATHGFRHGGSLPPAQSVVAVEPATVELVALKQAEDGRGWILRLWETSGKPGTASVRILGAPAGSVQLAPYQLTTLRVNHRPGQWRLEPETLTEMAP